MTADQIKLLMKIIDLLALSITLAPAVRRQFDNAREEIRNMIADQRDPTPEEFTLITAKLERVQEVLEANSVAPEVTDD